MRTRHLQEKAEDHGALKSRSPLQRFLRISVPLTGAILLSTLAMPAVAFAQSIPIDYYPGNAGYAVFSSTVPPASASSHLRVPTLTCTKAKAGAAFGTLVENANGSISGDAGIVEQCVKGVAEYFGSIDVNSTITQLDTTVSPNDSIILSASESPGRTSATFRDETTGFTQTITGSGATAEYGFIGSVPDVLTTKVAHFAKFSFTDAKINGAAIGSYTASEGLYEAIQTNNGEAPPGGKIEVEPGSLGTSSFPLKWVSAG
jgi:hypothetical protein